MDVFVLHGCTKYDRSPIQLLGVLPVNFKHSLPATPFLVLWFAVTIVHRSVIVNATQVGVGLGMKLAQLCTSASWSINESGLEMNKYESNEHKLFHTPNIKI